MPLHSDIIFCSLGIDVNVENESYNEIDSFGYIFNNSIAGQLTWRLADFKLRSKFILYEHFRFCHGQQYEWYWLH